MFKNITIKKNYSVQKKDFDIKFNISKIITIIFIFYVIFDFLIGYKYFLNLSIYLFTIFLNITSKIFNVDFNIKLQYDLFLLVFYTLLFYIFLFIKKEYRLYFKKIDLSILKQKNLLFNFITTLILVICTHLIFFIFYNYNKYQIENISLYKMFCITVIAPLTEETIFKGILFNLLKKIKINIRIIILSLFFIILHFITHIIDKGNCYNLIFIIGNLFYLLYLYFYSIFTFKIYIKQNNLTILFIIHSFFGSISILMYYILYYLYLYK